MRVGWIPGDYNLAYLLTKTTITGNMRHKMVESIFYNTAALIMETETSKVEGFESKRRYPCLKKQ